MQTHKERAKNMNLSQLEYFQIVAKEEHISRAAEKLHISQPSLSTTIRRLENELDTLLFDRVGRNIYLNEAGKKLLNHVNYIFSQITALEDVGLSNICYTIVQEIIQSIFWRFPSQRPHRKVIVLAIVHL